MRRAGILMGICLLFRVLPGKGVEDSLIATAKSQYNEGNADQALKTWTHLLSLYESRKDAKGIAETERQIGETYRAAVMYEKAHRHLDRSLSISRTLGDSLLIAKCLNRKSAVCFEQDKLDSAFAYADASLRISRQLSDSNFIANNLNLIGSMYREEGKYNKAIQCLSEALAIMEKRPDFLDRPNILNNLAVLWMQLLDYEKAYRYADEALTEARHTGVKVYAEFSARLLYQILKSQGNAAGALRYHELMTALRDSIFSETREKQIAEITAMFESREKDQENRRLADAARQMKSENRIQFALIVLIALLFCFMLLLAWVRRNNRIQERRLIRQLREKNQEVAHQKEEIAASKHELEKINEMKDRIFSIIAHDLRSPVNSLQGILSLLKNENMTSEEIRPLLLTLTDRVDYTSALLDNLLNWSKAQLEGFRISPVNVNLGEVAGQVAILYTPVAEGKKISLTLKFPGPVTAFADRDMAELVIRNLVSNALKFTPRGGNIRVCGEMQNGYAMVCVEDSGIGIHEDVVPRLFGTEQYSTQGTNREKGTGLGLMLCREFIEKNGGKIWVESQPGKGSRFCFMLPRGN